ncbi:MAG: tRNA 2-thiocytidine biosynthesis TtcA family protein [Alistipes sp.]|nr:tRNA 2-thiocytidine biosynthesis TtcA family protein [Alistipes sp.]
MKLQQLLSLTRKAVYNYDLIRDGDKIAVGISGGKDSLALLYALANLRRFYPAKFELAAITVNLGIEGMDFNNIQALCKELEVPYYIVDTRINEIVFEARKEENPCSLCAKLRKGSLNEKAIELGCDKIAYAHHKDDVVETFLMSLTFEGRLHTFSPKTYLSKTGLTLIRPLIYIDEARIVGFQKKQNLPVVKNLCPADGFTKREEMKRLVREMNMRYPNYKERVFTAIQGLPDWKQRIV